MERTDGGYKDKFKWDGQKIQKEIKILRDKVESIKTRWSNWREAFIHNQRKFKNGIALIEAIKGY